MKSSVGRQQDRGPLPLRPTQLGTPVTPPSGPVLCRPTDVGRTIQRSVQSPTLPDAELLIHSSLALMTISHDRRTGTYFWPIRENYMDDRVKVTGTWEKKGILSSYDL